MNYQNRLGDYQIWFPEVVVSKLRPRFRFLNEEERERRANKKGISVEDQPDKVVHLATRYRDWKEQAIEKLENAIQGGNIFGEDWDIPSSQGENFFPAKHLDIQIDIFGKHRGDKDNQFASLVDALVSAKVLGEIDKKGKEHYADAPSFMPSGGYKVWKSIHQGALITLTQLPKNNPYFEEADLHKAFNEAEDETLLIWIPGKCFSKLRPRGDKGWVGNNREYVAWKNDHSSSIRYKLKFPQINQFRIDRLSLSNKKLVTPTTETLCVSASFIGKGHGGDCDNRLGAVLDLLVASKIAQNDGVNCIPHGNFKCYQSETGLFGTLIEIKKQPVFSGNNFFLETTTKRYFTSQDLISQGWTKGLIKKFLVDPDKTRNHPINLKKVLDLFSQERVGSIVNIHDLQIKLTYNLSKRK